MKIKDIIEKIETWFIAITLSTMSFVTFGAVVSRFTFKYSLPWSEELVRYLFVWLTMIASSIGVRRGAHVGINVITDRLPKAMQVPAILFSNGVCIIFSGALFYLGCLFVKAQLNQHSPALGINMGLIYGALPVGALLMIFSFIDKIMTDIGKLNMEVEK